MNEQWLRRIRAARDAVRNGIRPAGLSAEAVTWAYRLLLDREPESRGVVESKRRGSASLRELRNGFLSSAEFLQKNPATRAPTLSGHEPAMSIEEVTALPTLQVLFDHIQAAWQQFGEQEPFWSVLTAERFRQANIEKTKDEFYASGRGDVDRLFDTLARNRIDPAHLRSCLEYGCGLGRVTHWLAQRFAQVHGFDISRAHLRGAEEELARRGVTNVVWHHLQAPQDLGQLPKVDLIFSFIVLQHNPPPIIRLIVRNFLRALNPDGVALFQVPTYRAGYRFSLHEYLANEGTRRDMEMHVLPQSTIFEIARQEGARVVEVLEDGSTGMRHGEVSNTFLVQRPGRTAGADR